MDKVEFSQNDFLNMSRWALLSTSGKIREFKLVTSTGKFLVRAINSHEIEKWQASGYEVVAADLCNRVFVMAYKQV